MKPTLLSTSAYLEGIRAGDKVLIGKAITLIESSLEEHREAAADLLGACRPYAGGSLRLGITGVPGVGKSTFIEALGTYLIAEQNKKVGVLAIDPSSNRSGGSILGDKTRMEDLSMSNHAFVRPSPSSGSLGGVRETTHNTITILEAAGFDVIMIETVGVGQSETMVHHMVDCFILLMLAGAGDSLQGIKRGIMEMADLLVINKADGDNLQLAKNACREYQMGMNLLPDSRDGWKRQIHYCSSTQKTRLDTIWSAVSSYVEHMKETGIFEQNRADQAMSHFEEDWENTLKAEYGKMKGFAELYARYQSKVQSGELSSLRAAQMLFNDLQDRT